MDISPHRVVRRDGQMSHGLTPQLAATIVHPTGAQYTRRTRRRAAVTGTSSAWERPGPHRLRSREESPTRSVARVRATARVRRGLRDTNECSLAQDGPTSRPTASPTTKATASASSSRVSREAGRSSPWCSNSCAYSCARTTNSSAGERPLRIRIRPPADVPRAPSRSSADSTVMPRSRIAARKRRGMVAGIARRPSRHGERLAVGLRRGLISRFGKPVATTPPWSQRVTHLGWPDSRCTWRPGI